MNFDINNESFDGIQGFYYYIFLTLIFIQKKKFIVNYRGELLWFMIVSTNWLRNINIVNFIIDNCFNSIRMF